MRSLKIERKLSFLVQMISIRLSFHVTWKQCTGWQVSLHVKFLSKMALKWSWSEPQGTNVETQSAMGLELCASFSRGSFNLLADSVIAGMEAFLP